MSAGLRAARALKVATALAAAGVGVFVGFAACIVASFAMSKGDLGIGVIDFDQDGVS